MHEVHSRRSTTSFLQQVLHDLCSRQRRGAHFLSANLTNEQNYKFSFKRDSYSTRILRIRDQLLLVEQCVQLHIIILNKAFTTNHFVETETSLQYGADCQLHQIPEQLTFCR